MTGRRSAAAKSNAARASAAAVAQAPAKSGQSVHELIRGDVLAGQWRPGERLQPVVLAKHYEASTTVIREALTRLAGEQFLKPVPNRGFFVPELSLAELRDLTEVRCRSEEHAIELAIQRGDVTWESELIALHHQLSRTPRTTASGDLDTEAWSRIHAEFHAKLLEASGVQVLIEICRTLANSTALYRRWAAPTPAGEERDVAGEHSEILEAVLRRDAGAAQAALRSHYETTVSVIVRSGLVPEAAVASRS